MSERHIRRLRGCFSVGSERRCEVFGCDQPPAPVDVLEGFGLVGDAAEHSLCAPHASLLGWFRHWLDQPAVDYIDASDEADNPDNQIHFGAADSFDVARDGWRVTARDGDGRVPRRLA